MEVKNVIIGGGISGLTLGYFTKFPVFEKESYPGGLLASYYFDMQTSKKFHRLRDEGYDALFEKGGGHWIWGLDKSRIARALLCNYGTFKRYKRRSSVYLVDFDVFIPYPIQYNIRYLPKEVRDNVLQDLIQARSTTINDEKEESFGVFLRRSFGETLFKIFFESYNYMYTDGLLYEVKPPRFMKIPNDLKMIIRGSQAEYNNNVGYNPEFFYPVEGLGHIMWKLCENQNCKLNYNVTSIDLGSKKLTINDKLSVKYKTLYVAVPLLEFLKISNSELWRHPDPYTCVLVVNVIAKRGKKTPTDHWVYLSRTKTMFHRIGYYSNVDEFFLSPNLIKAGYVSAYIERVINPLKMGNLNLDKMAEAVVNEAFDLELIGEPLVYTYDFVNVAYTWRRLKSKWVETVIDVLKNSDVVLVGRYATWGNVEGIVESIEDAYSKVQKNLSMGLET